MFCATVFVELNFRDSGLTNWLAQASNEEFVCEGHKNKAISCTEKDKNSVPNKVSLDTIQTLARTSSLTMQDFSFQHMLCGNMMHFF